MVIISVRLRGNLYFPTHKTSVCNNNFRKTSIKSCDDYYKVEEGYKVVTICAGGYVSFVKHFHLIDAESEAVVAKKHTILRRLYCGYNWCQVMDVISHLKELWELI